MRFKHLHVNILIYHFSYSVFYSLSISYILCRWNCVGRPKIKTKKQNWHEVPARVECVDRFYKIKSFIMGTTTSGIYYFEEATLHEIGWPNIFLRTFFFFDCLIFLLFHRSNFVAYFLRVCFAVVVLGFLMRDVNVFDFCFSRCRLGFFRWLLDTFSHPRQMIIVNRRHESQAFFH